MQNKSQTQRDNQISKGVTFFCYECNNVGRVFVECWTDRSDRPFKIELLQHYINIHNSDKKKNSKKRFFKTDHCGDRAIKID